MNTSYPIGARLSGPDYRAMHKLQRSDFSPLIILPNLILKVSPYYMSPPSPDATLTLTRNPRTLIGTREKLRCGKWRENWRAAGADGSHFRRGATIPAGRRAGTWTTFPVDELTLDNKSPTIPKLAPILTPYGRFQRKKDSLDRYSVLICRRLLQRALHKFNSLRALGLLLTDGAPTVGRGKTF